MPLGVGNPHVEIYRLGPFLLASEIPLPELDAQPSGIPDVTIRFGAVPERLEDAVANETRWWASRDRYLLRIPGVAAFLVSHGREVVVEPAPDAPPGDIRAYLLSPIFSILCYQAGLHSLHASAVRVGDGVAAFLGHSGAGKSTLAACLDRRGFTVLSDDICLLDPRAADATEVIPVAPAIKLWRSALERLGGNPEELPRVFSSDDKYRVRLDHPLERLPLNRVYFLEWTEDPAAPAEFGAVEGAGAIRRLMEFTLYDYLMKPTGRQQESFLMSGRILSQVRAFVFRRAKDFNRMDAALDALEEHLRGDSDRPS